MQVSSSFQAFAKEIPRAETAFQLAAPLSI